jgi:hypothetical protein
MMSNNREDPVRLRTDAAGIRSATVATTPEMSRLVQKKARLRRDH